MTPSRAVSPDISIVIPVHDEADNIAALVQETAHVFAGQEFEIIVVNDGSHDDTGKVLKAMDCPGLRVITHKRQSGQSRAILTGMQAAKSDVVCTLDGDGQNPPLDLLPMLARYHDLRMAQPELGMIIGERVDRQDHWSRKLAAGLARQIRRVLFGDDVPDSGCGTRVMNRQAVLQLPIMKDQHRYLTILMKQAGFGVVSMPVGHRPRLAGHSKYTITGRAMRGMQDILGKHLHPLHRHDPGEGRED